MPWKEKTVMEQRKEFIEQAAECTNFSALCREYGISRKTGYKWLNRFREDGSVSDRSRRPKHPHAKTAPVIEAAVLAMREENPSWGGRTIHAVLEADGIKGLPSAKTCSNILKRNGCIKPEESLKHRAYQRFEREQCNSLWQTDFKGDFGLLDGSRCYPLDILDDHSRFCIRTEPKNSATGVKESFIQAFQEYGLPDAILSDHGSQFAGFKGGYTHFERWLMDLDILPIHGRIMHPQTQGKIERFHRTMKAELLREPFLDLKDAKKHFARWRWKYNEIRPHSALNMKTPASVYTPSKRLLFEPKPYEYTGHVCKVNNWGYLRFGPVQLFLSETMANTYLEVVPASDDTFSVRYRNFQIALIDANAKNFIHRRIRRL